MTPHDLEHLRQHPDFIQLVRRKQYLTWTLTLCMLAIYFGFVLVMAFAPHLLAQPIADGVTSVGIAAAIAVIVLSFLLTAVYVHQTNRAIDPLAAKLLQETRP